MNAILNKLQNEVDFNSEKTSARVINFPSHKSKGGRPSKYSVELMDEICVAILNSDKGIARLCKEHKNWPCKKTIFNWLNKSKDFRKRYAIAKDIQIDFLMDELLKLTESFSFFTYVDDLGNKRIHPFSVDLMRLKADIIKWKIVKLLPRKYQSMYF
jgi:hypothetical protein